MKSLQNNPPSGHGWFPSRPGPLSPWVPQIWALTVARYSTLAGRFTVEGEGVLGSFHQ